MASNHQKKTININNIITTTLSAISIIKIIEDCDLIELYGALNKWLEAYSLLIYTIRNFFFGWISLNIDLHFLRLNLKIDDIETHLTIILCIIINTFWKATFRRAKITFKKDSYYKNKNLKELILGEKVKPYSKEKELKNIIISEALFNNMRKNFLSRIKFCMQLKLGRIIEKINFYGEWKTYNFSKEATKNKILFISISNIIIVLIALMTPFFISLILAVIIMVIYILFCFDGNNRQLSFYKKTNKHIIFKNELKKVILLFLVIMVLNYSIFKIL